MKNYYLRRRFFYILPLLVLVSVLFHFASAQVYVPDKQYGGYFDSNGIYTVFGYVSNNETQPVLAKVEVAINSGKTVISQSHILPLIYPSMSMMPFKFKFPQITSGNPLLQKPKISFILTNSIPLNIEINYGRTLVQYPDGHLSGYVTNTGNETVHNVNVYALVSDKKNQFIDEVQSTQTIPNIAPAKKAEFVMFPDPKIAKQL